MTRPVTLRDLGELSSLVGHPLAVDFIDDPPGQDCGWGYHHIAPTPAVRERPRDRLHRCGVCGALGTNRRTHGRGHSRQPSNGGRR